MILIFEGIVMCFILLIICVVGIANGPVGLVTFFEQDVKDRVIEMQLTTKEKIKKQTIISSILLFVPIIFLIPYMVYGINGVTEFKDGFIQMTIILLIMGLFDRLFIDWYWVGHTKAWEIKETEDLKPYIPKKTLFKKWFGTLVTYPLYAALVAWIMTFIIK